MPAEDAPEFESLLVGHEPELRRWLARRGAGLLRFESVSDLVQGVYTRALASRENFEYRGEAAFRSWLEQVAAGHVANRNDYWRAQRRDGKRMLRLSSADLSDAGGTAGVNPAAPVTSPSSFAMRRERAALAARALALLPARDREIARAMIEGKEIAALAEHLGISPAAAERARLRTLERFKKTLRLLLGESA